MRYQLVMRRDFDSDSQAAEAGRAWLITDPAAREGGGHFDVIPITESAAEQLPIAREKLYIRASTGAIVEALPSEAADLFEAWDAWRATPERSGAEARAWSRVLEAATEFLDDTFGNLDREAEDVDVLPMEAAHA